MKREADNVDGQARYEDDDDDDGPAADPQLEGGMPLPIRQVIVEYVFVFVFVFVF